MKKLNWFELALIAVVMGAHLYAALSGAHNFPNLWFTRDDAYYYFKVAQNITEGHGSSFDGISLSNGYHPLWLALNIPIFALARYDLILPLRLLTLVMAALSAATSILLYRLLRRILAQPVAMLAAAFWAFDLTIHNIVTQAGMETGLVALALVLLLNLLQKYEFDWQNHKNTRQKLLWLAAAATLLVFSRLDTIYLALLLGIWLVFRGTALRSLFLFDLLATISLIIFAFAQRAGLNVYMADLAEDALFSAALLFGVQSIFFYFLGLYQNPKNQTIARLARQTGLAISASGLTLAALMALSAAFGWLTIPRAVLLYYLGGISLWAFFSRLLYRAISPWPVSPSNPVLSPLQQLCQNWRTWLKDGLCYYSVIGLALSAYMLLNRVLFGTFMPVSGQIKRWWGSLGNNAYGGNSQTLPDIFALDPTYSQPWQILFKPLKTLAQQTGLTFWAFLGIFTLLAIGLVLFNRKKSLRAIYKLSLIPLMVAAQFQALFYGALPYAARHEWYWVMQMLSIVILLAFLANQALSLLPKHPNVHFLAQGSAILASAWLAVGFCLAIYNRMPFSDPYAGQAYMDVLPLLEQNTEPGAIIGMTGGGNTGYYIQGRTIVNMDGLINSYDYFKAMQSNQGAAYLHENLKLDYVFANPYILLSTSPYRYQFQGWLTPIESIPAYGNKQILRFAPPQPEK
jgi:hypothetical protein